MKFLFMQKNLQNRNLMGVWQGSPGYTRAAHWVANHLAEWNIQPGYGESFFREPTLAILVLMEWLYLKKVTGL